MLGFIGRLFAPGGLIDGFFNTQLRPYVLTSGKVWQLQPADLAQFQRAATIRDLFFAGGSATPTVRFDITLLSPDAGVRQAIFDFDGTAIVSIHGPPRVTQIIWPGQHRMQSVRLVFEIRAGSVLNPFAAGILQDFRYPSVQ